MRQASAMVALLLAGLAMAGCAEERTDPEPADPREKLGLPNRAQPLDPHRFDPARVEEGDSVGPWEITALDLRPGVGPAEWVGTASFSGEVEIWGRAQAHPDADLGILCFLADEASAERIPRMVGDERIPWFCFENQEEAAEALDPARMADRVRITVSNYIYRYARTDIHDSARLEEADLEDG